MWSAALDRIKRHGQWIILGLLLIVPVLGVNAYILHLLIMSFIFAVLTASWNLLFGFMGIYSFGHQAFFGLGAYVTGILVVKTGITPWFGLFLGGVGAALISLLVSWPTFRLKGPYVAIVTLAFAEVLRITCANWVDLTRGQLGLSVPGLFEGVNRLSYYYVVLIIFLGTWVMISRLIRSSLGLGTVAIRESQEAAESIGVDVVKFKRLGFILTSFIAGLAGAFYAHYIGILTPDIMGTGIIFSMLVMGLFGGIGTLEGPVVGAFLLTFLSEYLRDLGNFRFLVYSLVIGFTVLFLPGGLVGGLKRLKVFSGRGVRP